MVEVWSQVQGSLKRKLGAQNFEIWIRPIQPTRLDHDGVHLQVPNRYYRDWVRDNYGQDLRDELFAALGHPVPVEFRIAGREAVPVHHTQEPAPRQPIPGVAADKVFDNFVVGASNQFAHAAALAVAEAPGDMPYNPLFIYGGTGLGKTHLLHAVGNRIRQDDPGATVLYVTAEQFTNELIDALRYRQMPTFRDKYRKLPTLLLMDDVQFLSGKDRTQEELFHTFEWLKERGRQIVFTADVLPREIRGLEPRLRTRCESGMLADTQPPDLETLVAILHQKADDLGLNLDPEVAQWVAARVRGSIRELEGVLHRLSALCRLHRSPATLLFAQTHLSAVLMNQPRVPQPDFIIERVAEHYEVSPADILGKRRNRPLVLPRHVAMWLIRKLTARSFPDIGRVFQRDHATVQHACRKISNQLDQDHQLRRSVEQLEHALQH